MHRRTKHPFYGWIGFPTGKVKFGSFISEEVLRELEEETGLTGKPEIQLIIHYLVKSNQTKAILEDMVIFYFVINEITGKLIQSTIEGENMWMTLEKFKKEERKFEDKMQIIEHIEEAKGLEYQEQVLWVDEI